MLIQTIDLHSKETQPPKRYTPSSIIKELEKQNLGTKATRATIVETLFDRGYVKGKAIEATELGIQTLEILEKYVPKIIDPALTRSFEDSMGEIREGKQKEELQQIIKENKLEKNIIFTQWIERDYIPSLYGIMDIYLHAANYEPFGFVIAEAMINGTPVVSSRTGAAADAIDHLINGYLSLDNSGEELAKGIFFMLENDRKKIGEAGKIKAMSLYAFEHMYNKHLELYQSAYNTLSHYHTNTI